jgi:hypothetical protein
VNESEKRQTLFHLIASQRTSVPPKHNSTAILILVSLAAERHNLIPSHRQSHHQIMTEFEIYLPAVLDDGTPVDAAAIDGVKDILSRTFGGYTHLRQRNEGAWSIGGVTFRDEITIIRVLDDGTSAFDMSQFKRELEASFKQQSILIVRRQVDVIN